MDSARELTLGRAAKDQATRARRERVGVIEDLAGDAGLVSRALQHAHQAAETARVLDPSAEGRARVLEAEALLLRQEGREDMQRTELASRAALGLLSSVRDHTDVLAAYVALSHALAKLATIQDAEQRTRLEVARPVLEAGEIFALQVGDHKNALHDWGAVL
jgi:hypothetical protein